MARLRLFAAAREAAGTSTDDIAGDTVGAVLDTARQRYGAEFGLVLDGSRIWVNGEQATHQTSVEDGDEVAVLPPVSGG